MNRLTRTATALTTAVILGFSLTACGEDEEPKDDATSESSEATDETSEATDETSEPTDATTESDDSTEAGTDFSVNPDLPADQAEFCEVFLASFETLGEGENPTEEQWAAFQEKVAELEELGAPDGLSDEELYGFEVFTEVLLDLDYETVVEHFDEDSLPGVSKEDNAAAEAFTGWAFENCLDLGDLSTP